MVKKIGVEEHIFQDSLDQQLRLKDMDEAGEFEIQVGSSSRDIRARATFILLP